MSVRSTIINVGTVLIHKGEFVESTEVEDNIKMGLIQTVAILLVIEKDEPHAPNATR